MRSGCNWQRNPTVSEYDPVADMAAFDSLSPRLRRAISNAQGGYYVRPIRDLLEDHTEAEVIGMVHDTDRALALKIRQELCIRD